MPEVDVQSLDFLDQQQDRLARRAHVGTFVGAQTAAPRAQLVELRFIQSSVDAAQCKTENRALPPRKPIASREVRSQCRLFGSFEVLRLVIGRSTPRVPHRVGTSGAQEKLSPWRRWRDPDMSGPSPPKLRRR